MEIIYASDKVKKQCTDVKKAKMLFGGNKQLAVSLMGRINSFDEAVTLKDIIAMTHYGFHNLDDKHKRKLKGYFAVYVKTRKEPWRIILRPLDKDKNPYEDCRIDYIASIVEIVEIKEVSNHYE